MLYQPIQSQFWWSDFKVYPPTWERFGTAPQTSEALADAKPAMRPGILPFAVLKIIINDTKSVNAFKEYWTYSWINFPSKIYSTCLFKELVPREKAASLPFKSSPTFAAGFSNAPISLLPFFWNSFFHLPAYSTLHRETLTCILPCGRCELCHFFHLTTALTGISKRESCVFYLGRGFFKLFSFSAWFHKFKL